MFIKYYQHADWIKNHSNLKVGLSAIIIYSLFSFSIKLVQIL